MAVLKVRRYGDPVLRRRAEEIATVTPQIRRLAEDMIDTMYDEVGIGLAAPQIGASVRLLVVGDEEGRGAQVLVNPVITPLSDDEEEGWEGCLSVPGLRGMVPRYSRIRYGGFDPEGRPIEREAEGFHARVVQHECDHLRGVLYPMRVRDFSRFGFTSVLFPELDGDRDD